MARILGLREVRTGSIHGVAGVPNPRNLDCGRQAARLATAGDGDAEDAALYRSLKTQKGNIVMSKKYRKRPVVIEAVQATAVGEIDTLEGVMSYQPGDWIITGVKGEKYPCKDDSFRATYEPVE